MAGPIGVRSTGAKSTAHVTNHPDKQKHKVKGHDVRHEVLKNETFVTLDIFCLINFI